MLLGAGCTGGDARAYMDCGGRCYFPSTNAATTLSIACVTRLVGRLKLFVRIEKANCSRCLVVTYAEWLFTRPSRRSRISACKFWLTLLMTRTSSTRGFD